MITQTIASPSAIRVLLVEDEETDAILIQRALRRGGITNPIDVVEDGEKAILRLVGEGEYADRETFPLPGLVLLDLNLPRYNGIEVLRRFKPTEAGRRTPVVVLTSSAESRDLRDAYDNGANSYLTKPVTFEAFIEVAHAINLYWLLQNRLPPVDGR